MRKGFFLVIGFLISPVDIHAQPEWSRLQPAFQTLIFPLQPQHTHASSIVSLPNGDILAAWYQGSGEREANDVRIMGSRLKKGSKLWSKPFLMADSPDLPDCNPVLFLNGKNKLFLVWIVVLAHRWEFSLLRIRTSVDYLLGNGAPLWDWQDELFLHPDQRFARELASKYRGELKKGSDSISFASRFGDSLIAASKDLSKTGIGWMTRIQPLRLSNGRILLPLYSDGFSMSLIAISDDDGGTWRPSLPIVGRGNVQPALVQMKNGHLVAYMRDNGEEPNRVQISESSDSGFSWTAAGKSEIPNTASVELLKLQDSRWAFVGDDVDDGRYRLSLYISDDEGKTWKGKWALEQVPKGKGSFSYPCIIQTADGFLHISYSYSLPGQGESIKYLEVNPKSL
jgi:predicted neuraminidase